MNRMAALGDSVSFRPACVSLDLEVGKDDRIHAFGAVRSDTGRSMTHSGGDLAAALTKLDAFADGGGYAVPQPARVSLQPLPLPI